MLTQQYRDNSKRKLNKLSRRKCTEFIMQDNRMLYILTVINNFNKRYFPVSFENEIFFFFISHDATEEIMPAM